MPLSASAPWVATVLGGTASIIWGTLSGRPYWTMVCSLALVSALLLVGSAARARPAWTAVATPMVVVPLIGLSLDDDALIQFLTWSLGPGVLFMLSLIALAPLVPSGRTKSGAVLASLAFMAMLSMGCLGLLALYYLDAVFSMTLLSSNADLMWPLTYLLAGGALLSVAVYLLDVAPATLGSSEVSD